ncbi:MAG: beta strand repeat-containing protein, partial [Bryobacteraceae bacterium]
MRKLLLMSLLLGAIWLPLQAQQPVVAIHVSELTAALATMPAGSGTPTGAGTTGNQWWPSSWNYFVMYQSLEEALTSDGTPFVVVTDADISAGSLLTPNGLPAYPIVISLASEAISSTEITPLLNYVGAGGFLFVGSSSFTRNPNGTSLGDFALANQMGLHMANASLQNWQQDLTFTNKIQHQLVSHIPSGTLTWIMPLTSDDIPWGISSPGDSPHANSDAMTYHYIWQTTASSATVVSTGDGGVPYIAATPYGQGYFIYDAAMQPLIGNGGWAPGMYTYGIFRNAIEWAFASANQPIIKLSPWPYQYNAAYMVRHDFEDYQTDISDIESSAQNESAVGARGSYYFCTGTLDVEMGDSASTIASLQAAVTQYGATIGSHNGGLQNPNNPTLAISNYDFWHWGPDEALNAQPPGYANGSAYASASIAQSFAEIDSWLTGYETNRRHWVAPYFNGTREGTFQILQSLGVQTAGEQKIGPFPHWTVSTQTNGLRYSFLSIPVSDWFINGPYNLDGNTTVAQAMEDGFTTPTIDALVDYYYGLGALINLYSHGLSTDPNPYEYLHYVSTKPAVWPVNPDMLLSWWTARKQVSVSPSYAIVGNRLVATATVSGSTTSNTAIELVIPNWALASTGIQVKLNGAFAAPSSYRIYDQGIKVNVGTTVSAVEVSYPLTAGPTAQPDSYSVNAGSVLSVSAPGVLSNDSSGGGGALTAAVATQPANGSLILNVDGSFTYTPANGFVGTDSFSYVASNALGQSGAATVIITVNPAGSQVLFNDAFAGQPGPDPLWNTVSGSWNVENGVMNGSSPEGNYGFAYANGSWTDYTVQATVEFSGAISTLPYGTSIGGGIGGRVNLATGAHYGVWIYPEGSIPGTAPAGYLQVLKFTGWGTGAGTPMASASLLTVPVGTLSHTLLVTFQGSTIQVSFDGVQYINVTDNGFASQPAYTSGGISLDMWTNTTPYLLSFGNISVNAMASAPVAQNDAYSMFQAGTLNVAAPGVLGNDTSSGGFALTAVLVSQPAHGTLSLQSNGSFTYTPQTSFNGVDTFTYQAKAAGLLSNIATATITVIPPLAMTITPAGVVGGSASSGTVTLSAPASAPGVTVSLASSNPVVAAVPASVTVPTGSTSVEFAITTSSVSTQTQVTITATYNGVSPNGVLTVLPTGSQVLFSDDFSGVSGPDPLWVTQLGTWSVASGIMTGSSSAGNYANAYAAGSGNWTDYFVQGQIQFPAGGWGGGIGGRVNTATGAHYAAWVYPEGSGGGSAVLKLVKFESWITWSGTPMAQASLPSVGTAWHTLLMSFQGSNIQVSYDGVQYINVTDSGFDSQPAFASGTISLDMWTQTPYVMNVGNILAAAALTAPVAQNDAYTVAQSGTLSIAAPGVLSNDTGSTGLTAILVSQPAEGTLSLQSNGSFTYTPQAGFTGVDTFTYQASAAGLLSNIATVTITVTIPAVSSVSLGPVVAIGGSPSSGTVTLSPTPGLATAVSLVSSNPSVAAVPASVTVPAGSTTEGFTVTTNPVAAQTQVTITASYGGTSQLATLTILPTGSQMLFSDSFSGASGLDPLWTTVLGTWNVANGMMQGSSPAGTYGYAYASGNWTDYSVQGQLQFPAGAYGGGIGGLVNTATGAHYAAWVYPEGSAGGSAVVNLIKFESWGTWSGTPMAQASLPGVGTTWHTLLMSFQGSNIQVSYDGVQYINVTDNGFDSQPAFASGSISLDMWTETAYQMNVENVFEWTTSATPVAQNDAYSVAQGGTLNVAAPGVLGNDTGGTGLTAILVSQPAEGALSLQSNGSFTYTPQAAFSGVDTFTYQASAAGLLSNIATVTITVTSSAVSLVNLNPVTVTGGSSSTGTVTLSSPAPSGGAVVALTSSNTAAAQVPASVTVAAGATSATFPITTSAVASTATVTISATYNSTTQTAGLTVTPPVPGGVSVSPTSVTGGSSSTGTVTLSGPAPSGGAVVALTSSNVVAAQVPASATVAAGATSATFPITTSAVASTATVTISATYNNTTQTVGLTVTPPVPGAVSVSPTSVTGGSSSTGTVTLSGPAPSGGAVVALTSSNTAAAQVPASVTVAAGATSATFPITTSAVASTASVTISATYGATLTTTLTVNPPTLSTLTLNPTSVTGGSSSTGTVTLSGPAPSGGA